jgi:hypothetical protein
MLTIQKKLQGHTTKRPPVRHQTCIVPSRNHLSSREMLRFVRGVCQNFHQSGQFFYHSILVPWHEIKQGLMYFWSFLNFLEFKSHGSQCLCPSRDTNMFESSFQFIAQGINLHTRTQIWFSNTWWFAIACTCSSNLNYGHYMARNSLNVLKRSTEPWKIPKFNMSIVLVHVNNTKRFRVIWGSEHRFIFKHALFPLGTTCLLVRCSDLWEVCVKTFVKVANSFTIASWCHDLTSSKVSCISDHFWIFLEFKSHGSQCLCPSRDTNMFENSFQFTAHGINSHISTQIWFSNPWWFAVACTCSSNLNYNHYMARNSLNVLKMSNEPWKFQNLTCLLY